MVSKNAGSYTFYGQIALKFGLFQRFGLQLSEPANRRKGLLIAAFFQLNKD
jgi:hypothetical protein